MVESSSFRLSVIWVSPEDYYLVIKLSSNSWEKKVPWGSFQDVVRCLPVGQSWQAGPSASCARVGSLIQGFPVGTSRIRGPLPHFESGVGVRKSETFFHYILFDAICNFTFVFTCWSCRLAAGRETSCSFSFRMDKIAATRKKNHHIGVENWMFFGEKV